MWRRSTRILSLLACALALCLAPTSAHAGSYWWTGTPAVGSNGFSWQQTGGWNPWGGGSRCDNNATTYPTGSYCQLVWNVPANLDPVSGSIQGSYRQANSAFEQQMYVEGNGTTVVQGDTNTRAYNRQWSDMTSYLYIRVINTGASTNTSAGTVWFDASSMTINLVDPYSPGLNILEGYTGWKGTGGACIRYGYGEAGSGLDATSLANVNTGAVYDNPGYQTSAMTTGMFQNDRNCVGVPPPGTGTYTLRAAAVDKSGNYVQNDFNVSFDVTPPSVSAPSSGGTPVTDGRVFGSATAYRPPMSWTMSDAHSGLGSVVTRIDGQVVSSTVSGATVTMTPPTKLALGTRSVAITVTDAVGNATTVTRSIVIADDAKPTITVDAPTAAGDNTPVLDVSAADDHSGVNPASWTVRVNGATLPVSSNSSRLQVSLGRLVNGAHSIEVRVTDNAGNQQTTTFAYTASGDTYTPPGLNGIYVLQSPTIVDEDGSFHVVAITAKDGRPVVTGRYETSKVGSSEVLAGKSTTSDGSVDLLVEHAVEGPMQLVLTGSGLSAATYTYTYRAKGTPPYCEAHPSDASCRTTTGGGDGSGGTGGTDGGSGSGTGGDGSTTNGLTGTTGTTGTGTGSTNEGTSGGPSDKVPPKFTLKAIQSKKGVVKRTGVIQLRLTSNERANYTIQPIGSRVVKSSMTTKPRVLKIKLTGALLKRIRKAKTPTVIVKVRVVGIDPNKNTVRRTITLRIRV